METAVSELKGARPGRPPTKKIPLDSVHAWNEGDLHVREDGWSRNDWRGWLDRMMPDLPMHLRYPIVSKICKIRTAIFHRLNSGQNLASPAVQRRAQLAELCLRVAKGDSPKALAYEANQLISDRESQMVLVAYHVTKNLVNEDIRNQAARAIELAAIRQAQALAPARTHSAAHED